MRVFECARAPQYIHIYIYMRIHIYICMDTNPWPFWRLGDCSKSVGWSLCWTTLHWTSSPLLLLPISVFSPWAMAAVMTLHFEATLHLQRWPIQIPLTVPLLKVSHVPAVWDSRIWMLSSPTLLQATMTPWCEALEALWYVSSEMCLKRLVMQG